MASAKEEWFASGEHVTLRPVLEPDLERLAYLLGECPIGQDEEQLPWTTMRLKNKFEDKDKPGLWDTNRRMYSIARHDDSIVGYVDEAVEKHDLRWITLHIAESLADRDAVGRDAIRTYMAMAKKWNNLPRVATGIGEFEEQKRAWFSAEGFALEITCEAALLYLGKVRDIQIYGWLADWVEARRAPEGIGR